MSHYGTPEWPPRETKSYNNHPFYGHAMWTLPLPIMAYCTMIRNCVWAPAANADRNWQLCCSAAVEQRGKLDFDSLKSMAESVQGSFCFTALDENNTLYIVKGSNPMCLLRFAQLGLYIYASTKAFWKGVAEVWFPQVSVWSVKFGRGHDLEDWPLWIFKRLYLWGTESFRFGKWYNWYDSWRKSITRSRRIAVGDVQLLWCDRRYLLLLDYGYSVDEIEIYCVTATAFGDALCGSVKRFCCEWDKSHCWQKLLSTRKWFLFGNKIWKYNPPKQLDKKKGGVIHEKQQVIAAYSEFADVKQYPKFQRGEITMAMKNKQKATSARNHLVQDSLLAAAPRLDRWRAGDI